MKNLLLFSLLLLITPNQVSTYSSQTLPISQHSKQWKGKISDTNATTQNKL